MPSAHAPAAPAPQPLRRLGLLSVGALGVVYGDIGTSPIYALRECFTRGVAPTPDNVLGVLSLVFWALTLLISVEYQLLVLRNDNRGEGGLLALLGLLRPQRHLRGRRLGVVIQILAVAGTALMLVDSAITPAISVLSAVEGLAVAQARLEPLVVPITVGILIALFRLQRRGTAGIGALFGPVTAVWFLTMAVLGLNSIAETPAVLAAVDPRHAAGFLVQQTGPAFVVLGAVFLVVTGAEALYADLGHFGLRPIQLAWFALVFPALLASYFGQGAHLLRNPETVGQPFFELAPGALLYPLIGLATAATVIASQAVISGAFSITRQAIQMGLIPRLKVIQTSAATAGQVYVPALNVVLAIACIAIVLVARSSSTLAVVYGLAISAAMVVTTTILYFALRWRMRWSAARAGFVVTCFLLLDLTFFAANLLRIPGGGWIVLLFGAGIYGLMRTWAWGRQNLIGYLRGETEPLENLFSRLAREHMVRVPGTAVFLTAPKLGAPPALQHHLRHAHALHERVVLLTVVNEDTPRVPEHERLIVEPLEQGFFRLYVHYGFREQPDLPRALAAARTKGLPSDPADTTYFIGRETLIVPPDMPWFTRLRERLYVFMFRNALRATDFYRIPPRQAVEIGLWVEAKPLAKA